MKLMLLFAATVVAAAAVLVAAVDVGSSGALLPMHVLRGRVADVEDVVASVVEEEAAYPRRRILYDSRYASYNGLTESKAACYGSCPGRGQPYSGRSCLNIYQCKG
ncbi:hypothetical protein OsI_14771 [Oryza sativa Indica Group]|uniref:Uncharacterized protein n=2 Tax=Oryza TaxID=4527 RepID=A0A0E0J1K6_ORYNI|nr:hypothetical protein OsI_14771 [Oryza sativa Indica Group]